MYTDRIEKRVVLPLSRNRVWRAISDVQEFSRWFGIEFKGTFTPGAHLEGKVMTTGYEQVRAEIVVDQVKPEYLLSWRWHPSALDPEKDYSRETMTLVVFELSDVLGGTRLSVTESGFTQLPQDRRQEAYDGNDAGWTKQMENIVRYLARAA